MIKMEESYEILGSVRVIQKQDKWVKVQISSELNENMALYLMFLSMNVEVLAKKLGISINEVLKLMKQNIEVEPMIFD